MNVSQIYDGETDCPVEMKIELERGRMSIIDGLELEELQDRAKNADVYLRALTEILEICERVDQPRPETGRIADVARKALSSAISADGRAWLLGYPSAERLKKKYEK